MCVLRWHQQVLTRRHCCDVLCVARPCTTSLHALCSVPFTLCGNGLWDVDMGEEGIDCGGPCDSCFVTVTYSSATAADGATVNHNVVTFTALFGAAVSNVAASDFGLSTESLGAITTVTPTGGVPAIEWVLTVELTNLQPGAISIAAMPVSSGAIHPPNLPGDAGYAINYVPPVPTLTSSQGASGSTSLATGPLLITATFDLAVSGVTATAFPITLSGGIGHTATVQQVSPTVWVLRVDFNASSLATTTVTVGPLPEAAGVIYPANAASATAFVAELVPPLPSYTTSAPSPLTAPEFIVTATFDTPVSGVQASDFNLDVGPMTASTSLTSVGSAPATVWVLTVTIVSGLAEFPIEVGPMVPSSGVIQPPNQASPGGLTISYTPPVPSFTADGLTSGSTTHANTLVITATFTVPVAGVSAADFSLDLGGMSALPLAVAAVGSQPTTQWTLTLEVTSRPVTPANITLGPLAEQAGNIVPPNAASVMGFVAVYAPPLPVISSSEGVNGTKVAGLVHSFTVTFSTPVSGVSVETFGFTVMGSSVGTSLDVAAVGGTTEAVSWVLTVTLTAPLADAPLTITVPRDGTTPLNTAATNAPFMLQYVAPACEADPCGITAGRATACANIDDLAGTFTCTCASGRYGELCLDTCPDGYTLEASLSPPACVFVTPTNETWFSANCTTSGGSFASIHTAAQASAYAQLCTESAATGTCWVAGSDAAVEGTWAWADGSDWNYENWAAGNPDNVRASVQGVLAAAVAA